MSTYVIRQMAMLGVVVSALLLGFALGSLSQILWSRHDRGACVIERMR